MLLMILLILTGTAAALILLADFLAEKLPAIASFLSGLTKIRIPIGLSAMITGFLSLFNWWWPADRPGLTCIIVFFAGALNIPDFIMDNLKVHDGPFKEILDLGTKYRFWVGFVTLAVILIKIIDLLGPFFRSIL